MFIGCTEFKYTSKLAAFRDLIITDGNFIYPWEFIDFREFGISLADFLQIEDWTIFIREKELTQFLDKIKLFNLIFNKRINLYDYKLNLKISTLESDLMLFFKFELKEELKKEKLLEFFEFLLRKVFLKFNLINEYDILPINKILEAQLELNLPYVNYTTEDNRKLSIIVKNNIFISYKFKDYDSLFNFEEEIPKFISYLTNLQ